MFCVNLSPYSQSFCFLCCHVEFLTVWKAVFPPPAAPSVALIWNTDELPIEKAKHRAYGKDSLSLKWLCTQGLRSQKRSRVSVRRRRNSDGKVLWKVTGSGPHSLDSSYSLPGDCGDMRKSLSFSESLHLGTGLLHKLGRYMSQTQCLARQTGIISIV